MIAVATCLAAYQIAGGDFRSVGNWTTRRCAPGLVGPGHIWRRLDVVGETHSTNDDLMAAADLAGAVLPAEHQTRAAAGIERSCEGVPHTQMVMSFGVSTAESRRRTGFVAIARRRFELWMRWPRQAVW